MADINYQGEVNAFLASHPRYKPTSTNQALILEFLEDFELDFTADNLSTAYLNLAAKDELDLEAPEEPAPAPAPRRKQLTMYRNGKLISGEATRL